MADEAEGRNAEEASAGSTSGSGAAPPVAATAGSAAPSTSAPTTQGAVGDTTSGTVGRVGASTGSPADGVSAVVDPNRTDPAMGKTSNEYRSIQARALGAYIFLLVFVLIHVVVMVWPPPVVSRDVIDTLEREEQLRDDRRIEAQASARGRYTSPPPTAAPDSVNAWRRDSARAWTAAEDAQRLAQLTRQLADSVRARRARAVLDRSSIELFWGVITIPGVSLDLRLILLALAVGGLGAFVHCAQSYATYVGNRTLALSWSWWYVLRPLIGASLAAIFYFAVRGALFPNALSVSGDISPFGIAAIGSLSGMFSKQAVDKLDELFRSLFRTDASAQGAREERPVRKPEIPTAGARDAPSAG